MNSENKNKSYYDTRQSDAQHYKWQLQQQLDKDTHQEQGLNGGAY